MLFEIKNSFQIVTTSCITCLIIPFPGIARKSIERAYERYPEQPEKVVNFAIDSAMRAELSGGGFVDSFLEGKDSYISYRGRMESFIERNVERADIWMSYYAGRCTGSLVQAAGGTAAMFFGAMDAISGGIGTAGSAALGQAPAAALTAALTVEGVVTAGVGAAVLVDVLRKQAVASAGMTQSVGRGLDRKRNEEAKEGIKAGDKTPKGREYTQHGAERANERGFDSQDVDNIIDNNYKNRTKEIDKLTGEVTWRYQDKRGNTVITNERGNKIVTVYSYPSSVNGGNYIPKN